MPERTTLTTTEYAILGLIARKERSGYDLRKAVERGVGYFWTPAKSQIYSVLPRLVAAGLARERRVVQDARPDKRVYWITTHGREELRRWLDAPQLAPEPNREPFLLKVFLGEFATPEALLAQVRARRAEAEELDATLREMDANGGGPEDFFPALTRSYGRAYTRAVVRWAREVERDLAARVPAEQPKAAR